MTPGVQITLIICGTILGSIAMLVYFALKSSDSQDTKKITVRSGNFERLSTIFNSELNLYSYFTTKNQICQIGVEICMVYVKTTNGVTSVIDGNKIEKIGDEYFVTKDAELIGVFDVGVVQFIYKTRTKGKTHEL